uniref:Uncharacterized protein n=1 Tax=Arundo donax TaxID=35708 RepID=A0A0A8ZF85_ARUDO
MAILHQFKSNDTVVSPSKVAMPTPYHVHCEETTTGSEVILEIMN